MALQECSALLAAAVSASSNRSAHAVRQIALAISNGTFSERDLVKAGVVRVLCGLLRKTQDQVAEAASALAIACRDRPALQEQALQNKCVPLLCGLLKAPPKVSIPSAAALCSICAEYFPAQDEARAAGAHLVLPPLLLSPSFDLVAAAAQTIASIVTLNIRGQESLFSSGGFAHCAVVACLRPPINNVSTSSSACAAAAKSAVASLASSSPVPSALFAPKPMDSTWDSRCAWALLASGCIAFDMKPAQILGSKFGCVHVAISFLDSDNGDIRSLAARALGCFCVNNRDLQLLALELGALQRLNRMLSSPMLHNKQHAALCVSFLCSANTSAQLAAVDTGALSVVQDFLRNSRTEIIVTGLKFIFNLAYDNTKAQEQFLKLGVMTDIFSILKSAKCSNEAVSKPLHLADSNDSDSDRGSEDAERIFTETLGHDTVCHLVPIRSIDSTAEIEWAVKALTNLIQLAGGSCNPSAQAQAASFGAFDIVTPLLLSRQQEIVQWACRCLAALVNGSVHAPAVCLVVPRLIALADDHVEAAAALRIIFSASPAAVAAREVFRSLNSLLHQLPAAMFASAARADTELSIISQLRSIICTKRSHCEELGNIGGAVACNSFIILGGVKSLIACFDSDLCGNKTDAFRISESIGNCISTGTARSVAAFPPISLCRAALSRFSDPRLEQSEKVVCVLALVSLFQSDSIAISKVLLRSRALVPMMRDCIEHPKLLHLVSAAAGLSVRVASIFINSGIISLLSCVMSPSLTGKQLDVLLLACKCLEKLASAPLSDECAASAAAAILKCSLIGALAVHVAPLPPFESPRIVKAKSFSYANVAATANPAFISGAVAASSKQAASSPQKASVMSAATAAVWAVIRTWFIWQPTPLNAHAIQAGLVESLCRAVASHGADEQASLMADLHENDSHALLHAVFALAYLAYEDRFSATIVAESLFNKSCGAAVARLIMRGFAHALPLSPMHSSLTKSSNSSIATSTTSFIIHSTQLINLLALLICHDPGIDSVGADHRNILIGDSALSALQLLTGSWPYLQGEGRRWVAVAVCLFLPLALSQSTTSSSIQMSSPIISHSQSDEGPYSDAAPVINPVSDSLSMPKLSIDSQSPSPPLMLAGVAAGSPVLPIAGPADRLDMPHHQHGIMSALYANQYARFHPLLTFALQLQESEDTPLSRIARCALIRLPLPLQMLAATQPLNQRISSSIAASPRSTAARKSLCLLCMSSQAPPRLLLLCGHTFHIACARSHIEKIAQCPLCRWRILVSSADASAVQKKK